MFGYIWTDEEAPPCRRGWTAQVSQLVRDGVGSPVQTGMDRAVPSAGPLVGGLPRADGDGPDGVDALAQLYLAPPCRRGWTPYSATVPRSAKGSPVQTGMDRYFTGPRNAARRLPRADGDGPA